MNKEYTAMQENSLIKPAPLYAKSCYWSIYAHNEEKDVKLLTNKQDLRKTPRLRHKMFSMREFRCTK